jgi:hypothetical protein
VVEEIQKLMSGIIRYENVRKKKILLLKHYKFKKNNDGTGTEYDDGTGTEYDDGTGTEYDDGTGTKYDGGTGTEYDDGTGTDTKSIFIEM